MHIVALAFNHHKTLRLEEIAGALIAIAGGLLVIGGAAPLGRRFGMIGGGIGLAIAGVLAVLAIRYGKP